MSYVDPEELLGSLDGLVNFIVDNTQSLTAKGLNPTVIKGNLERLPKRISEAAEDIFRKFWNLLGDFARR